MTVYLDARNVPKEVIGDSLSKSIQKSPMQLGRRNGSFHFRGKIDDIRFYNQQLTDKQVSQLYEAGVAALASVPAESRTTDMQSFLTSLYRGQDERLKRLESQLAAVKAESRANGMRRWYVNSQGQTMVVVPGPAELRNSQIDHGIAISTHEVTVAEFRRFKELPRFVLHSAATEDSPIGRVSWYLAAEYCNWLSKQEGIPENQWIYEPNDDGRFADGMRIKENFLELGGYRLPTQAEWKHACLAGARGAYGFGEPMALLKEYGRYLQNSSGRPHPVESLLPNEAGLFDMHGNLTEWAQDAVSGQPSPVADDVTRFFLSGAFNSPSELVQSGVVDYSGPSGRSVKYGFRPARAHCRSSP